MNALKLTGALMTFLTAAFIFYVSSLQFPPSAEPSSLLKPIIYHLSVFAALGFFISISLMLKPRKYYSFFLVVSIGILYAISDELHQAIVPTRYFSLFDIFTDVTGFLAGITTYLAAIKTRNIVKGLL